MVLRNVPRFARPEAPREETAADAERLRQLGADSPDRSAAKTYRRVELVDWLRERHGLEPAHAGAVASRLLASAPRIRGAFLRWWLTGQLEDLEVDGYGLRRLVREKEMSVIGALLTLSLLAADERVTPGELDEHDGGDLALEETLERAGG